MALVKKISKSVITIIPLLLEIKVKTNDRTLEIYLEVENRSINYDLKWSIAYRVHPYTGGSIKCDLCLTKKLVIMKADPKSLLNARDEFVSQCRHMKKFTLTLFRMGEPKRPPYQFFPSNFYKRRIWSPKLSDF